VTVALQIVAPTVTQLVLDAVGADPGLAGGLVPDVDGPGGAVLSMLAAVLLVVALPYGAWAVHVLLRQAAWPLLGPDQSERIAELEAVAQRSAERGRLARELHDSVGHALTITTLQAAAASRSLDTDPDAARRALAAIEETGRAAMADLDHVLGLLRDPGAAGSTAPLRTLADVPRLVDDARRAGGDVVLSWGWAGPNSAEAGDGAEALDAAVPRATSREAYRLVQEAVTNALRHAPGERVTVRLVLEDRALLVEVSNPLPVPAASAASRSSANGARRGLTGMAERVRLVGGTFQAGPVDRSAAGSASGDHGVGRWVVRARFGLSARGAGDQGAGTAGSGA
jgi:signal transduction histidine kinase